MSYENLVGKTFNSLIVKSYAGKKGRRITWNCVCKCGKSTTVSSNNLKRGQTKSCGCARLGRLMLPRIDLSGQKFNRLLVVSRNGKTKTGHYTWDCVCDCGKNTVLKGNLLQTGNTKSCGCLTKEVAGARFRTHGESGSSEYRIWVSMKQRCENTKNINYCDYGGRGISICERWQTFPPFLEDMGRRPDKTFSIERIDNNKGYNPENCIWATQSQQVKNRRPIKAIGNFSTEDLIQELNRRNATID